MTIEQTRITIEGITPQVDDGRFAVKAVAGDTIEVGADIFKDGHDFLRAAVLWRKLSPAELGPGPLVSRPRPLDWSGWEMELLEEDVNDRWLGSFKVDQIGGHAYTVVVWTDRFRTWRDELKKKHAAKQDVASELLEGLALIERFMSQADGRDREDLREFLAAMGTEREQAHRVALGLHPRLAELMERNDPCDDATAHPIDLPLWVDRDKARCGAWYEIFPRSQGTDPERSATFEEAALRLPEIAAMGFDVLYLTPIHPIGESHRKGANNAEECEPGEPGSPWAIGSVDGGHTAVHPDLGTIEEFDDFVDAAAANGMEIALDLAYQCSPDHPWVDEHPEWFRQRPDGSIKYAENPPKKYQDIYPIDFETRDRDGLYNALLEVVLFWASHGVKIFRVDNPHTKAFSFWEWLITAVHREHPDALFLAEAFTRPKRMKRLAKLGFTQGYTYFTWRNTRQELEEYATELFLTEVADYMRPNFFANTPDILHEILQQGGRPAFIMRLVLAGTLSPTYGIYSGFELCENTPREPDSEEYLDSEKYQYKVWDWDRPGNIKGAVTRLNQIRRDNPALRLARNIRILESSNPDIIAFAKVSPGGDNVIVVAVNTNPFEVRDGTVRIPRELYGGEAWSSYEVEDLLWGDTYTWQGEENYVRLDPQDRVAHVLRIA